MTPHAGQRSSWLAFAGHNVRYALSRGRRAAGPRHIPGPPATVPGDYFGICAATGPDPQCDDYVLSRLHKLGLRHVRVDITYADNSAHGERFLRRLIDDGFAVCLHPVQPVTEARQMHNPGAQARWRDYLATLLSDYAAHIEMLEIGATCNRRKWAGYANPGVFLSAWRIAYETARSHGLTIAGPNVTDYEPPYNIGYLGLMRAAGCLPDVHSDNLFVERATEPEAFDHKILGHRLAPLLKMNLVRKARDLAAISDHFGIARTICTHTAWSLRRINRILHDSEAKQADYVARYACLAAASGALTRLYWGPLIGQRAGLIDDGTTEYPDIPHVTLYARANGDPHEYRMRPAFHAYRTCIGFLAGTEFRHAHASAHGLEIHEFVHPDRTIHAIWTRNGAVAYAPECYAEDSRRAATAFTRDGHALDACPAVFGESPVYLTWPTGHRPTVATDAAIRTGIVVSAALPAQPVVHDLWAGMIATGPEWLPALLPDGLEQTPDPLVMRDRRNRVWAMPDPRDPTRTIVVKRFRIHRHYRRLLQRWKPSRAQRSWNAANELQRRGIHTPAPIAFFHSRRNPSVGDGYFICERLTPTGSIRQAFNAFRKGATAIGGVDRSEFLDALVVFLTTLHHRGVFYRDLSAGNVLFRAEDGSPSFALIDTARARFYAHPITFGRRLADLKRIAHPLDEALRMDLLRRYTAKIGKRVAPWMQLPFLLYNWKHRFKAACRRVLPRKT